MLLKRNLNIEKELEKSDDLESKCNLTLNYWNKKSWSV